MLMGSEKGRKRLEKFSENFKLNKNFRRRVKTIHNQAVGSGSCHFEAEIKLE